MPEIAPSHPTGRLKLLTWNIFMMPDWAFQSPRNLQRARAIADELAQCDFDILCFEKAFDYSARRALEVVLGATYPYRYGPANDSFSLKINSGVWVLSRIPLTDYKEIQFRESVGVERFSRKGALLVSGQLNGQRFHLVATHLQGNGRPGRYPEYQATRNLQVNELAKELIEPASQAGVPIFLCGDFCTARLDDQDPTRESESYLHIIRTLRVENGPGHRITLDDNKAHNDLATDNLGRTAELDYILIRKNGAPIRAEWERFIFRRKGWDGPEGRQDLSYRYAVGATIWFNS